MYSSAVKGSTKLSEYRVIYSNKYLILHQNLGWIYVRSNLGKCFGVERLILSSDYAVLNSLLITYVTPTWQGEPGIFELELSRMIGRFRCRSVLKVYLAVLSSI